MFDTGGGVIWGLGGTGLQTVKTYCTLDHSKNQSGPNQDVCEVTYTLLITAYEPIHHNICQCSCRVNSIINKYPPVRAVISPRCFPIPGFVSAWHTYTQSSVSHPSHCSVRGSRFDDKAWHYRVDLSLLCLCEWHHDPSDLVINIPMAIHINAFTLVDCGQQSHTHSVLVNISNQREINYLSGGSLHLCLTVFLSFPPLVYLI